MWYLTKKSTTSIESAQRELRRYKIDPSEGGVEDMPKKKPTVHKPWTKEDLRQLKAHSKTRTPVVDVAKAMKRTEAAVRQKAKTISMVLVIAVETCLTRVVRPVCVTRYPFLPLGRRLEPTLSCRCEAAVAPSDRACACVMLFLPVVPQQQRRCVISSRVRGVERHGQHGRRRHRVPRELRRPSGPPIICTAWSTQCAANRGLNRTQLTATFQCIRSDAGVTHGGLR